MFLVLHTSLNSIEKIETVNVPIRFIHDNRDSIIPTQLGRELVHAANEPKQFCEIPNADHNDTFFAGGDHYYETITRFVRGIPSLAPG
ncbi:MAG: alpha/beta hydrolase [Ignavibacteria bacterium]|nr:alpha/beta hydrolase [Ignavibacteria bacterium]